LPGELHRPEGEEDEEDGGQARQPAGPEDERTGERIEAEEIDARVAPELERGRLDADEGIVFLVLVRIDRVVA
jgi:hypothetical protein